MRVFYLAWLAALCPVQILASLNAFEMLMFYEMYRADWEKNGRSAQIGKTCEDCDFEEFIAFIDRLNQGGSIGSDIMDPMNPEIYEIDSWDDGEFFVYDGQKLLGGLWTPSDDDSRPGHPSIIERLAERTQALREDGDPARLGKITAAMEAAHYRRRHAQAEELIFFVNDRLRSSRTGEVKKRRVHYTGGEFEEIDSLATIEAQSRTRRPAIRRELAAFVQELHESDEPRLRLAKRAVLGGGLSVMSLQRSMNTLREPRKGNC